MIPDFLQHVLTHPLWWFGFFVGGGTFFILGTSWHLMSGLQSWIWAGVVFIVCAIGVKLIS